MIYDIVTVVYDEDIAAHRLQARSMALYLSRELVHRIIVIQNSVMPSNWPHDMLHEYGDLTDRVVVMPASAICALPEVCVRLGWYGQQILKLLISRRVATERYLILDAKNLLVFPLHQHHLENGNKIISFRHLYHKDTALEGYLQNVERYFNVVLSGPLPPSNTPVIVPTELVIQMIQWIEQKEGDFAECFMRHGMTEFLMFTGYLISTGQLDAPYDFSGPTYTTVWPDNMATNDIWIEQKIAIAERDQEPFFSVHRRAWPLLSAEGYRMIADFWQRRGLV